MEQAQTIYQFQDEVKQVLLRDHAVMTFSNQDVLHQLLKVSVLASNKQLLWRPYDHQYINRLYHKAFNLNHDLLGIWCSYDRDQSKVDDYIVAELELVFDQLTPANCHENL